jgi:hypothetical protein
MRVSVLACAALINESRLSIRYVHEDPYRSDHRFHGWTGLCSFNLAKEAQSRELQGQTQRAGSGPNLSEQRSGAITQSRRRDHVTDAREHLLRALELNPHEDQYVRCLSQILIWGGQRSAAKNLLLNFCVLNPNNPEGFRSALRSFPACPPVLNCMLMATLCCVPPV